MSQKAKRFNRRYAVAEIAADDGYDFVSAAGLEGLIARSVAEARQCNREWSVGMGFYPAYTYCPDGLMALSDVGIDIFNEKHPDVLPWNLYKKGPAGQGYYSYNLECTREQRDALVEAHARFAGWLKAAAELPILVKAIKQSVSPRGCGSRRTHVYLWAVAKKFPSPHRLQHLLKATQCRAKQILAGYDGRGCTLRSALIALMVSGAVGKAAVIAACRSLTGENMRSHQAARDFLVQLHLCNTFDSTDGVAVSRTAEPVFEKLGVRVYRTAKKERRSGWTLGFLVLAGNRSYHVGPTTRGSWGGRWLGNRYVQYSTPEGAVYAAFEAWTAQKKLERQERNFLHQLQPAGFTPLVYYQDSRDAGNCHEGTISFMRRIGVPTDRKFVPVGMLLPHMGETRVMNTLKLVAARVAELQLAA